jgi:hypothetical protein
MIIVLCRFPFFFITSMCILAMHMPGASSFKLYDCDVFLVESMCILAMHMPGASSFKMQLPKIMKKIYLVLEIYLLKQ